MSSSLKSNATPRATRLPNRKAYYRAVTCVGEGENEVTFCSSCKDNFTVAFDPEARARRMRRRASESTSSLSSPCQSGTEDEGEVSRSSVVKKKKLSYTKRLKRKVKDLVRSSEGKVGPVRSSLVMTTESEPSSSPQPSSSSSQNPPLSPSINTTNSPSTTTSTRSECSSVKSTSLFRFGRRRGNSSLSKSSNVDTASTTDTSLSEANESITGGEDTSIPYSKKVQRSRSTADAGSRDLSNYIARLEEAARNKMQRELDRKNEVAEKERVQMEKQNAATLRKELRKSVNVEEALEKAALELALTELGRELAEGAPGPVPYEEHSVEEEGDDEKDAWDSLDKALSRLAEVELNRELVEHGCQCRSDHQDVEPEGEEDIEEALEKAVAELKVAFWKRGSVTFQEEGLSQEVELYSDSMSGYEASLYSEILDEATEEAIQVTELMKEGGWVL